jgi:MFS family permease
MRQHKAWLIVLLAITLSGDTMLTVALIWTATSTSSSTIPLGLTLALMSVVPYGLQVAVPRLKAWVAHGPMRAFATARSAGLVVAAAGLLLPSPLSLWALYGIAGVFTLTVFIAQQALETMMAGLALRKVLTAKEASRISQAGIQLGAFVGGALGGLLLDRAGIKWTFAVLMGTLAVGALIPALLRETAGHLQNATPAAGSGGAMRDGAAAREADSSRHVILWLSLVGIAALTVQLGAFNYLIPIILQKQKQWAASDYGLISAAAGVGALVATVIGVGKRGERWNVLASVFAIALADYGLWASGSVILAAGLAFMVGYAFNTLRIRQREFIFENVSNDQESAEWAGRTTVVFQVMKAVMPLFLALSLERMGLERAGPMFAIAGCSVAACLLVLLIQQVRLVAVVAATK